MEGKARTKVGHCESYKQESSLHRTWEGLNFDRRELCTSNREPLRILNPGRWNQDQGPDFLDAEIQIGGIRHHGHVELHLHADDWHRHGHHRDPNYDAVTLHVVLHQGRRPAVRTDGSQIPELCLGSRVAAATKPMKRSSLACCGVGRHHLPLDAGKWLEEAGIKRLEGRARKLQKRLLDLHCDWSQLIWEEVATFLGGPVNAHCFQLLAQRVDWGLARKYVFARDCLEALLFGASGMLEGNPLDDYHGQLQECWQFLMRKHRLRPRPIPFKFHRMRPAGFPHVRIAQLASIATSFRPICSLLEIETLREFASGWKETSEYWAIRRNFGNTTQTSRHELGEETRNRILVNALAPLWLVDQRGGTEGYTGSMAIEAGKPCPADPRCAVVAEGGCLTPSGVEASFLHAQLNGPKLQDIQLPCLAAESGATPSEGPPGFLAATIQACRQPGAFETLALLDFLRQLPPENNRITRQFLPLGLQPGNALQAQGMLWLHKEKCSPHRCGECDIGRAAMGARSPGCSTVDGVQLDAS